MPLLDHFHPPLYPIRHWESFHTFWCTELAGYLNESLLPAEYFAEAQIHIGGRVEVDVATQESGTARLAPANGPVGTLPAEAWAPPAPAMVIPAVFPDEIEILIQGGPTGAHLVAAIELVSPSNKDRPESRLAFAIKCASYLQAGVGLIIVDVVTERLANLHDELIDLLRLPVSFHFPGAERLYAAAYRPIRKETTGDHVEIWPVALAVGQPLPTLPLALRGAAALPVDLDVTYAAARQRSRL